MPTDLEKAKAAKRAQIKKRQGERIEQRRNEALKRSKRGCVSKAIRCGSIAVAIFAVIVGAIIAGIPTKLGFYSYVAQGPMYPVMVGFAPAFMGDATWGFSYEILAGIDLSKQQALVTGANSGLGYWTSLALARQGASVVLACRTPKKCEAARVKIVGEVRGADVTTIQLDTSKLASVREAAKDFTASHRKLDMLFLNAGIAIANGGDSEENKLSEDGIEIVFATNVIGHHLLYKLLEPLLTASKSQISRVVLTSSAAHYDSYKYGVATDLATLNSASPDHLYDQSKLAQVLWAQELTRRLGVGSMTYVNSCHPGLVDTGIWDQLSGVVGEGLMGNVLRGLLQSLQDRFMWSAADGALTQIYLGAHVEDIVGEDIRGRYFHPQAIEVPPNQNPEQNNIILQKAFWTFAEELVAPFAAPL